MGFRKNPRTQQKYKVCDWTGHVIENKPFRVPVTTVNGYIVQYYGHFLNAECALAFILYSTIAQFSELLDLDSTIQSIEQVAERQVVPLGAGHATSELAHLKQFKARDTRRKTLQQLITDTRNKQNAPFVHIDLEGKASNESESEAGTLERLAAKRGASCVPIRSKQKRRRNKYDLYMLVRRDSDKINKAASKIARHKVYGAVDICKVPRENSVVLHYDVNQLLHDIRRKDWVSV